jgi:hypothetical protein
MRQGVHVKGAFSSAGCRSKSTEIKPKLSELVKALQDEQI